MFNRIKNHLILLSIAGVIVACFGVGFYFALKHSVEEEQQQKRERIEDDHAFCRDHFQGKNEVAQCLLRMREVRIRSEQGAYNQERTCKCRESVL